MSQEKAENESESKVFKKYADKLKALGFPKKLIGHWLCLIESESSFKTDAINKNDDGSIDWGLFQINDFWCRTGPADVRCDVTSTDLLSNDITNMAKCALKIYDIYNNYSDDVIEELKLPKLGKPLQGFTAWEGWKSKCMNKDAKALNRDYSV